MWLDNIDTLQDSTFTVPYVANVSGQSYTFIAPYQRGQIEIQTTSVSGQKLAFQTEKLNPFYRYIGKVYDNQGNEIVATIGSDSYNCFLINTIRKY